MISIRYLNRCRYLLTGCVFAAFLCEAADQSVYLLTGPTDDSQQVPVRLFTISDRGNGVSLIRTVSGDEAEESTCSVSIDPGERLVAVLAGLGTGAIVATIDMDRPSQSRRASIHYGSAPGTYRPCLKGFLARSSDGRLLQVAELAEGFSLQSPPVKSGNDIVLGVQIRPSISDRETEQLSWSYEGRIEISSAGWDHGLNGLLSIGAGGDGQLSADTLGPAALPYRVPKKTLDERGPNSVGYWLEVNNGDWLLLRRILPDSLGTSVHDILDKSTGQWQTLRLPGTVSVLKNFGDWFAGLVVEGGSTRESPGKARRKLLRPNAYHDPPADLTFQGNHEYSPGLLYLRNVRTQNTYSIETGEGDSEVLLIDSGAVYYRVNDSVFRAPIGPEKVGMPVLMATDPQIPDVHWAFLGPKAPVTGSVRH